MSLFVYILIYTTYMPPLKTFSKCVTSLYLCPQSDLNGSASNLSTGSEGAASEDNSKPKMRGLLQEINIASNTLNLVTKDFDFVQKKIVIAHITVHNIRIITTLF